MATPAHSLTSSPENRPEGPPASWSILRWSAATISPSPRALPERGIFYGVKANPAPERSWSSWPGPSARPSTPASVPEIEMALDAGATPNRISFGNTIKKERDIAPAPTALGASTSSPSICIAEVEKVARAAPGATRVLPGPDRRRRRRMARIQPQVRLRAGDGGRSPGDGLTTWAWSRTASAFTSAPSRQTSMPGTVRWADAAAGVPWPWRRRASGLAMVNMGGGFPARYSRMCRRPTPMVQAIFGALRRHFGKPTAGDESSSPAAAWPAMPTRSRRRSF